MADQQSTGAKPDAARTRLRKRRRRGHGPVPNATGTARALRSGKGCGRTAPAEKAPANAADGQKVAARKLQPKRATRGSETHRQPHVCRERNRHASKIHC